MYGGVACIVAAFLSVKFTVSSDSERVETNDVINDTLVYARVIVFFILTLNQVHNLCVSCFIRGICVIWGTHSPKSVFANTLC